MKYSKTDFIYKGGTSEHPLFDFNPITQVLETWDCGH